MTTETAAPAPEQSSAPVLEMGDGALTIEQARAMIDGGNVNEHFEGDQPEKEREDDDATPAQESTSQEGDADPEKVATAKTEANEPEDDPAIEMPQSWNKDARERWSKLDPETRQYLLEADKRDPAAIKRALNEAAEQRKVVEAEKKAIEAERERYLKTTSSDVEAKEACLLYTSPSPRDA